MMLHSVRTIQINQVGSIPEGFAHQHYVFIPQGFTYRT